MSKTKGDPFHAGSKSTQYILSAFQEVIETVDARSAGEAAPGELLADVEASGDVGILSG